MNKGFILFKTIFTSTSLLNIYRHSQDKKKRKKAIGSFIGIIVLSLTCILFVGSIAYAFAYFGYQQMVPIFVASIITLLSLIMTLLKSNSYLYGYKDYDLLMSMPFSVKTIVVVRFLLMYIKDLPLNFLISLSALIGYAVALNPGITTYLLWIILTLFIPLLPMSISSLLGVFIANAGSKFKYKKIALTILTFIITIPLFFLRFIIEYLIRNDKVGEVIEKSSNGLNAVAKYIPTISWFSKAVNDSDYISIILLIMIPLLIFIALILIISINYRAINSRLNNVETKQKNKNNNYKYKAKPIIRSIAFKEFKRVLGSTTCSVQLGLGTVLCILVGTVLPFINLKKIIAGSAVKMPFDIASLALVWPLVIYFFVGMAPSSAVSPSLEGKNDWILKSMPVDAFEICKGRMLFNIYMNLIPGLYATLTGLFAFRAQAYEYILGIIMIIVLCLFSTAYGMRCGYKHVNLNWENEIEVVKQGTAITLYLLPNMFGTMIVISLMSVLAIMSNVLIGVAAIIFVYALLGLLCYKSVKRLCKKA